MAWAPEPVTRRGAGLSQSGVALNERTQTWVGFLACPLRAACILEFFLVDQRVWFPTPLLGKQVLIIICAYSLEYPDFFESLCVVFEGAAPGDSVVLL